MDLVTLKSELNNHFVQLRNNIYLDKELNNKTIYRYTSFLNLIEILEGRFTLFPRCSFSDKHEIGDYSSEYINICYKNIIDKKRREYYSKIKENFIQSTSFNVSCWTYETIERYLMWKAYKGHSITVRIKTDINSLINSIRNIEYTIYCAPMSYEAETNNVKMYDIMFKKTLEYQDEKEIRIYAIKENNVPVPQPITLEINPQVFVKEIYFSPFIGCENVKNLAEILKSKYHFTQDRLNYSNLIEY